MSSLKPTLISHFLHVGPALSDFNSDPSLLTTTVGQHLSSTQPNNNQINQSINSKKKATSTAFLPTPILCSPFTKSENVRLELALRSLSPSRRALARSHLKLSSSSNPPTHHPNNRSNLESSTPSEALLAQILQSQPIHSNEDLDLIPKSPSKTDLKGKGKSPEIGNEKFEQEDLQLNEDVVLNLSMESKPYIVPVGIDSLFTVDVRRLMLYPAFWHGPHLQVFRGEWFYASSNKSKFCPCEHELSEALEDAYDQIRPWDISYQDELSSALQIGTDAEDKLKVHLSKFDHDVIFQSASQGRLYSTAVSSRISKTILTNLFSSISSQKAGYSGGTVVIRGWDQVQRWSGIPNSDELDQSQDKEDSKDHTLPNAATGINTTADMIEEEELVDDKVQVSELVFVIHGIGQKLAQSYDSFDFVHACNQLRVECHKATKSDSKVQLLVQDQRVQFIPIRWRHSLNFEMDDVDNESINTDQLTEPPQNKFTMHDIQIPDSIQFVREIITGLVLDVPLYMSPKQHKVMISAVIEQANRAYRMFCIRNKYYSGRKVSILAHSLGAALTVDILSQQPSVLSPEFKTLEKTNEDLSVVNRHFCFETKKVFLVGSPAAFFFHLHRAQLIAREGVSKTITHTDSSSAQWRKAKRITSDEIGRYGCLAAEAIYNIYMSTDPVAYCMNPCVDSRHSKSFKPVDAQSFIKKYLESIDHQASMKKGASIKRKASLASLSSLVTLSWFNASGNQRDIGAVKVKSQHVKDNSVEDRIQSSLTRPSFTLNRWKGRISKMDLIDTPIVQLQEPIEEFKKETPLGPMRFEAVNPTGSVDFVIPSLGLNQYVDMVTAHAIYWCESRFAKLILIGLFGQDEKLKEVGEMEIKSSQKHPN
ncbi:hypothetical protein O181_033025 [Austropuccinia psidii MF-1]|uniref:DDHD domain-containing protein n=1 Tax=Austropuccinia psidii MF-1 TaxID=1389203 RepID=A0A9Q3D277_9BASI|nr:hypothetical protein [Austropuccinia psidii MF-1]